MTTDDYDSPWKEILEYFFPSFMEFFLPSLTEEIDWSRGYESLDKELIKIMPQHVVGKRSVDKLMKVWCKTGTEIWLLVHIEVQAQVQSEFPERMYIYNYRLFDKYHKPIVSVAILADDDPSWCPKSYERAIWYTDVRFNFTSIKLLDYIDQQESLKTHPNPFGIVVCAHLEALRTKKDPAKRFYSKLAITKALYARGYDREYIINLYRFIDWIMALPELLEIEYGNEIERLEEENQVRYVTSIERMYERRFTEKGIELGIEKGIEKGERNMLSVMLNRRFGFLPNEYAQKLSEANEDQLISWGSNLIEAKTIEEVFQE